MSFVSATPVFCTGDFKARSSFLPDDVYATVLDNVVKATNDMVLTHNGKVYLGKRNVYPQKSWWFGCGGKMMPGETQVEASCRLLRRELGLVFTPEQLRPRLDTVGSYGLQWEMREQAPKNHGTCDISVVVTMELTEEEMAAVKADGKEYEAHEWVSPETILSGAYHPTLKRVIRDMQRAALYRQLEQLALHGKRTTDPLLPAAAASSASSDGGAVADGEIVAALRNYLKFSAEISKEDRSVVRTVEER